MDQTHSHPPVFPERERPAVTPAMLDRRAAIAELGRAMHDLVQATVATEAETTHHRGKLVWATGSAIQHPDGLDRAPRILFQQVPEPKTVKNRVHLDLRPGGDPTLEELDRLLGLGATRIGQGSQGPHAWVVLTDPEGNELCLPVPPGT